MAGETTAVTAAKKRHTITAPLIGAPWSVSYATGELQATDVKEIGYIPANYTLVGFIVKSDALDSDGTPAVLYKITVGSTDVATGLTHMQAATGGFVAIEPVSVTTETVVKVTISTAPDVAQAGDYFMTPVYTAALNL